MAKWVQRALGAVGLLGVVLCLMGWPTAALGQGAGAAPCTWGHDPVTLLCRGRPALPPPPPPTLRLESVPPKARVYRAPPPVANGADSVCESIDTRPLGETPVTLTPNEGLKPGKQLFCLKADGFAPALVTAEVAPSGPTPKRDPVSLVPLARKRFEWAPGCSYRRPPSSLRLRVDKDQPRDYSHFPPDSVALSSGKHKLDFTADGFSPLTRDVDFDPPGSPESVLLICLVPHAYMTVRNNPRMHPLDGLYLQVLDAANVLLWQGAAPHGTEAIRVPVGPDGKATSFQVSAFTHAGYIAQVPAENLRLAPGDPEPDGSVSRLVGIELSDTLPSDSEKVNRKEMTRECLDSTHPVPRYCAGEAYLRVHHDKISPQDSKVLELLKRGCTYDDISSCVALQIDTPVPPREALPMARVPIRNPTARTMLTKLCDDPEVKPRWLACLRLRQPEQPETLFLHLDGYISESAHESLSLQSLGLETGMRFMAAATIATRPGALLSLTIPMTITIMDSVAIGVGVHVPFPPTDVAVLPAQSTAGSAQGYFGLAGGGVESLVSFRGERLRFNLALFETGYLNASAATVGGYLDLDVVFGDTEKKQLTFFALQTGVAAVPQIGGIGANGRVPNGRTADLFVGLGFIWAYKL